MITRRMMELHGAVLMFLSCVGFVFNKYRMQLAVKVIIVISFIGIIALLGNV